jgi:magnesium-transporting ATPase (P-type)
MFNSIIYFPTTTKLEYFLLLFVIVFLILVIYFFVKANEHSNDLTLEKYYEFTNYAILSLIGLLIMLVVCFNYRSYRIYSKVKNASRYRKYSCDVSYSHIVDDGIKHWIHIVSVIFLIASVISYGLTADVKSDKTEYYKRCMIGSILLLLSVCTILFKYVRRFYMKIKGCKETSKSVIEATDRELKDSEEHLLAKQAEDRRNQQNTEEDALRLIKLDADVEKAVKDLDDYYAKKRNK